MLGAVLGASSDVDGIVGVLRPDVGVVCVCAISKPRFTSSDALTTGIDVEAKFSFCDFSRSLFAMPE